MRAKISEQVWQGNQRIEYFDKEWNPDLRGDLEKAVRCPDGKCGMLQAIGGTWVSVGGYLDFSLYQGKTYPKDQVVVVGVILIDDGKGGFLRR